jgi:hypothetical protein
VHTGAFSRTILLYRFYITDGIWDFVLVVKLLFVGRKVFGLLCAQVFCSDIPCRLLVYRHQEGRKLEN